MHVTQPRSSGPEYHLGSRNDSVESWLEAGLLHGPLFAPRRLVLSCHGLGRDMPHCSLSGGGTALPHESGSSTHSLWAKDRHREEGAVEHSSVIPGKSTSQLGEGRFYPLMSGQTGSPLEP